MTGGGPLGAASLPALLLELESEESAGLVGVEPGVVDVGCEGVGVVPVADTVVGDAGAVDAGVADPLDGGVLELCAV
jgi:hypothetical protein